MPPNRVPDFFDLLAEQLRPSYGTQPLVLGGASGPGGGSGVPPAGFVGRLAQSRVTYDTSEAATAASGSAPSLVDNLNHIRARLVNLETGSGSAGPGASGSSGLVKVSSLDTTLGFLEGKLAAGTGITLTKNNPGGAETLSVIGHAAVTLSSQVDSFLGLATQQLTLDNQNANLFFAGSGSGAAAPPTFRAILAADLGAGASSSKYLRGDMTWQTVASGSGATDELAKISATDTTAGYLLTKLVAGSNVTLTRNNAGGDETLTIASGSAAAGAVDLLQVQVFS